jgi:hypothetical protein
MENLLEYSARRNELDWAIRNKAKLTPEQRAKYRAMWEEMNSDSPPTAEVSFGPADLDPVEAAATPIAPDPVVAPKRPAMPKPSLTDTMQAANTLASLDNFDAAFQSNGNHYPTAVAAFAQQLVARGVDPAYAQRAARARAEEHRSPYSRDVYADEMAATENPNELYAGYRNAPDSAPAAPPFGALPDADPRTTRAERLAQSERYAADVDRRKEAYDRATGLQAPAEAGGSTANMRPGESEAGPGYQRVPAPRMPFGGPVPEPEMINDPEAIEDYTTREWDGNRKEYKPSPKDRAMAARGMVPVLNPDGSVGYSVGYPPGSITGENPNRSPGAAGRSGERQDLTDAGWKTETVPSPLGMQTVYRPGDRQAKQIEGVDKRRLARRAGIPSAQAQGMDIDQLRLAAQGAADDDAIARRASWKAQAMLAGGQPTIGSKAVTNALMHMPLDQRNSSLRYMLPGGQLAASVDGRQLDMAAELAQRTVMGALAGTAQGPLAAAQAEMAQLQAQAERDKLRRDGENTLADKYAREGYFGYDEFTVDEQQQMYDDLLGQGYKPADAQRAVDRVAKERRATKRKRWNAE